VKESVSSRSLALRSGTSARSRIQVPEETAFLRSKYLQLRRGIRSLNEIVGIAVFGSAITFVWLLAVASPTSSQSPRPPIVRQPATPSGGNPSQFWSIPDRDKINEGTVTVITAPAGGATSVFGSDMARVLDDEATIRVLPVLGKGPVRNVSDILFLKSIDMGAVASDVPEFYRLQFNFPDVTSKLKYIARLYFNEIHIIAKSSINSIFDLEGKRIIAPTDVGYYSAKIIFSRLNINASFDYATDDARSIQKMIDGEADAYVVSTAKVFPLARNIKNENRALHLIPVPYDQRLQNLYLPSTLSAEEYPNLLSPGENIDTVATNVLLVTFNWPENSERYNRVARFVDAFFSKFDEFMKPPRHPKWHEASYSADIPGWQRFKAAEDWLVQHNVMTSSQLSEKAEFDRFVAERQGKQQNDPGKRNELFREFLDWRKGKGATDTVGPR
jgi:TRAP-type uncharacterized transport system substrate-binding protein